MGDWIRTSDLFHPEKALWTMLSYAHVDMLENLCYR